MPTPTIIEVALTRAAEGLVMFRETWDTATFLSITQEQHRTRSDATPWTDIPQVVTWVDSTGRIATKGDVYSQANRENLEGDIIPRPWRFIGRSGDLEKLGYKRVSDNRSGRTNANGFMVDPLGVLIVDGAGDPIVGPVTGEQQKHEWNGSLLFEEDGTTPVLVA